MRIVGTLIKCKKCNKLYRKYGQKLKFTKILHTAYIQCPHCKKKHYLD